MLASHALRSVICIGGMCSSASRAAAAVVRNAPSIWQAALFCISSNVFTVFLCCFLFPFTPFGLYQHEAAYSIFGTIVPLYILRSCCVDIPQVEPASCAIAFSCSLDLFSTC